MRWGCGKDDDLRAFSAKVEAAYAAEAAGTTQRMLFCQELTEPARRPATGRVALRRPAGRRRGERGGSATARSARDKGDKCTCARARVARSGAEREAPFSVGGEGENSQRQSAGT